MGAESAGGSASLRSMTFVYNALVVLHFIGLASLIGGFLVQMRSAEKGINPAMWHGALTQVVTGVLLVGIASAGLLGEDETVNHQKVGVKLVIALVVAVIAFVGRRRSGAQTALWAAAGGLSIANVIIAVFWA